MPPSSNFLRVAGRDLHRQDKFEPGAIVVLTICLGRHHAGMRTPLEEPEADAHSTRGDDDCIAIGLTN